MSSLGGKGALMKVVILSRLEVSTGFNLANVEL